MACGHRRRTLLISKIAERPCMIAEKRGSGFAREAQPRQKIKSTSTGQTGKHIHAQEYLPLLRQGSSEVAYLLVALHYIIIDTRGTQMSVGDRGASRYANQQNQQGVWEELVHQ